MEDMGDIGMVYMWVTPDGVPVGHGEHGDMGDIEMVYMCVYHRWDAHGTWGTWETLVLDICVCTPDWVPQVTHTYI